MELSLPNIRDQQLAVFKKSTELGINQLRDNLEAPQFPPQAEVNEGDYSRNHLLRENEGFEPPHHDIIGAYFRHFQAHFPAYDSDKKLAQLLGVSSDRRIREYKQGKYKIPYGIWRKFLVITGRAPQEIIAVKGFLG
ncbi:hypothetical protein [Pseudoalteromonas ruthenica]|uniref:hypothetical protein n=1 Tax=Pseudoalteromonas ruthenica TaxID=151081 RepID=UPI00110BDBD2|nr:hypothetical protein [Pseudoalteromonas ruthenica]TMP23791.1 hypothetical protein CWC06_09570 [Pseudoalteromonas ruthenica]